MLRARRVAAGVALGAAALLSLPSQAQASPSAALLPETLTSPTAGLLSRALAAPSVGADDVRLWSVWQSDGTAWLAVTARDVPPDGSVVGWRFSAAPDASASEPPGGELPSFQSVCGQDTAGSGHKRVALAVDFGDDADARPGDRPPAQDVLRCVAGVEDATTAQLLASAARVRVNAQGEVVAVTDHPPGETDGTILAPAPAMGSPIGSPVLLVAGGVGTLLLLAGGTIIATRRRSGTPSAPSNL